MPAATSCVKETQKGGSDTTDLLVELLIEEKMLDQAWAVIRRHGGSASAREDLAHASEKTHPAEALEVYERSVEQLAGISSYAEAVKVVRRMAKLRSAAEHRAYLAALKERHRRKRNFMKLLG